jgi:elongation factor P
MPLIQMTDVKKGMNIILDGKLFTIIDFARRKMGRGGGMVSIKVKDIETGNVLEYNYNSDYKLEEAILEQRKAEFLYKEGKFYVFMDLETYEQYELGEDFIAEASYFLKENMEVSILMHEGRAINIQLPNVVVLEVTDTPPSYKGNTVSGGKKPAVLDTGLKINVPMFVENGEKIKVDTRTKEYIERA